MRERTRQVPADAHVIPAAHLPGHIDLLCSGTAWLGMLGQLQRAVLARDWPRATELAERGVTFPQPYPEDYE